MPQHRKPNEGFVSWEVRTTSTDAAERVVAEAHEAGAAGLEELAEPGLLRVFASEQRVGAVRRAIGALPAQPGVLKQGPVAAVAAVDWAEEWRRGLVAVVVAEELCVRPPFAEVPKGFVGRSVVIEPAQAFGTGGHASTRLALELVVRHLRPDGTVLDVGCGSGVLALAALALGASRAVAIDLDPLASWAATSNAEKNGLAARIRTANATLDALQVADGYGLVVANMIRTELEPLFAGLAGQVARGGVLILSGLLEREVAGVLVELRDIGLVTIERRDMADPCGDHWAAVALEMGS